jgi:large subunit ribosomal protein L18
MKSQASIRRNARLRRKKHIRKRIHGTAERPRLTVFRSLKGISAQLVDDTSNKTLITVSHLSKDLKAEVDKAKNKSEISKIVGRTIAEKAKDLKVENVVFDRNGYVYHGRVKALADSAREAGLKF